MATLPIPASAIVAVVPCLNEERAIAKVVRGARQYLSQVLVVDDGSRDHTSAAAESAGAIVLRHPQPQGKGAALRDGVQWAAEHGFDWALLMDGDGQHDSADIPAFLRAPTSADLVVGNRMADCTTMPWLRRWANRWVSRQVSRRLRTAIPDAQCGFRRVRVAAWQAAGLQATGYETEAEMLVKFWAAGFSIISLPVRTIYGSEKSKFHPLRDAWRWWRWWRQITRSLPHRAE
ncbi:glycosyltransferase family 2 protein [Fontisphaera persica]|uniref:glycosyltransferase family 2 protein n=1 Tax=Fontisphaera persica TaxID=2974023 RepID=UPI0024C09AA1|nr:glycosyltransferase family 2 protein [Fontisphaera persica]WCJ60829.1 glycosyltransferase family 2 protein [Fontisphaera persica]